MHAELRMYPEGKYNDRIMSLIQIICKKIY